MVGCWPSWGEEVAYTYVYMYMYAYAIYVHIVYMYIREEEERQRKVYSKRTGEEKGFIDTKHHTWIECASALHVRPPQPRTLECVLHRT